LAISGSETSQESVRKNKKASSVIGQDSNPALPEYEYKVLPQDNQLDSSVGARDYLHRHEERGVWCVVCGVWTAEKAQVQWLPKRC
jgi:hypothetical protein